MSGVRARGRGKLAAFPMLACACVRTRACLHCAAIVVNGHMEDPRFTIGEPEQYVRTSP